MVKLEIGKEYSISEAKKGESAKGPYFMFNVKAEKGYDKITVWASNPSEASGFSGSAKVVKIEDVSITATKKQSPQGEKWFTNYNVTAKLAQGEAKNEIVQDDPFELDFNF